MKLMKEIKAHWTSRVLESLSVIAAEKGAENRNFDRDIKVSKPPKTELGDLSFPMYPFAKYLHYNAADLARRVAEMLGGTDGGINAAGPYLNIRINRSAMIDTLLETIRKAGGHWGHGNELNGRKVMIEFSSPNTNKPLHLGHLRNDILGESSARILSARGAEVKKVNLINDRGVHICKSMLAYRKFSQGESPESLGVKSDRFVGDLYVKFTQWASKHKEADEEAQQMLQAWESGDPEVLSLWKQMNRWALEGITATYKRTGVSFDRIYRESETYLSGRQQVEKGLEKGVFFKHEDGSVRLDMSEIGLDEKVLLRSNGTSVYITQDLGTAISRHEEWPFDQLIYIVGNEQEYHFRVLFFALEKLGFPWSAVLHHLSYGMVNLPDGKMKSREGTVVDADDLIDNLTQLAMNEIRARGRQGELDNPEDIAEKIALAALHFFLLNVTPGKDMLFNPEESLSFHGKTGPYLQYMAARVSGLIVKAPKEIIDIAGDGRLLNRDDEWELIQRIGDYPELVSRSAEKLDPSILASGLYEIAHEFSRYYHEVPIAKAENLSLAASRMALARAVLATLKSGFTLLNIPFVDSM